MHLHYSNYVLCGGFFIKRNRYQSFNLSSKDSKSLVAITLAGAQLLNEELVFEPGKAFLGSCPSWWESPVEPRKQDQNPKKAVPQKGGQQPLL